MTGRLVGRLVGRLSGRLTGRLVGSLVGTLERLADMCVEVESGGHGGACQFNSESNK